MGKKNNRTCIICGNSYHFCPTCGEDTGKPTWYFIFDGQNCHDIYEVCTQYRDGEIDVKAAYEKISKLDISNIKNFADATRIQIEEILAKGKDVKSVTEKVKTDNIKTFNKK